MTKPAETPKFLFTRRADVEAADDWLLAGILTIDAPRGPIPPARQYHRMIDGIVGQLLLAAQTGALPADGATLGGAWPASVINTDDRDAMADWVDRSLTVMLHVALTEDGRITGAVRVLDEDDEGGPTPTLH